MARGRKPNLSEVNIALPIPPAPEADARDVTEWTQAVAQVFSGQRFPGTVFVGVRASIEDSGELPKIAQAVVDVLVELRVIDGALSVVEQLVRRDRELALVCRRGCRIGAAQ